jgi:hypothetical protein
MRGVDGMPFGEPETDITKNIKMIEWLKAELLCNVAMLFKTFVKGGQDTFVSALSNTIMICYLLGRRLGIEPVRIDLDLEQKIQMNIKKGHEAERWYGDLSNLLNHLNGNRPN